MDIIETSDEQEDFTELNRNIEAREEINEAAKDFYSGDTPREIVEIVGMPSHIYPGDHTQIHEVALPDLSLWITETVRKAKNEGTLPQTVLHYAKQLQGSDICDAKLEKDFLRVATDIYRNRFDDEAVERGRRELLELVGTFKVIRRNR